MDVYNLQSYQYLLPPELIAQKPVYPRDHSRLMIVDRKKETISEIKFYELASMLGTHDQLVFNNTKVIPARLIGYKTTGGKIEVLLSREKEESLWEALLRPAKKTSKGTIFKFSEGLSAEIVEKYEDGLALLKFSAKTSFNEELKKIGQIPLPHYIKRSESSCEDDVDYQTLFAKKEGAVAAPTAGLHFTQDMLKNLQKKSVSFVELTLHVGLGTFKPVQVEDIRAHCMHKESVEITDEASRILNQNQGLQIAVGTTSCRALESSVFEGKLISGKHDTNLFIYPGYHFQFVKALLTNFHLPGSSLLMLVSAFGGFELIKEAYQKAIKEKFRFYSYGDAMLII